MILEGKTREAVKLAAQLMVDNGLGDWHLDIRSVTSYTGMCLYKQKTIVLNERYIRVSTKEDFTNMLYHEIAHALVGGRNGHNRVFKAKYYELSGNMAHAGYGTKSAVGLLSTYCTNCQNNGTINKATSKWCWLCLSRRGKMVELEIKPNPLELVEWS